MSTPIKLTGHYFTIASAAEELGVTQSRVRQLVRAGDLVSIAVAPRSTLIPAKEIRRFRAIRKNWGDRG